MAERTVQPGADPSADNADERIGQHASGRIPGDDPAGNEAHEQAKNDPEGHCTEHSFLLAAPAQALS
jgi:hypothetical protein